MISADVYQGGRLVARLHREREGIRYERLTDIALERGFLATTLPETVTQWTGSTLPNFFLNLLPEGARLKLLLESSPSKDDELALLERVGWDTIGDVTVVAPGADAAHFQPVAETRLEEADFWQLFHDSVGNRADASIPGVQEKLSASTINFGVKASHIPAAILKLNPPAYPRLVHNEAFFMATAKECGLDTARCMVVHDRNGAPGLLVHRFDRVKVSKEIHKLHVEDGCQLLDAVPANKYELSIRQLGLAIAKYATAPAVEILRLIRLVAYSYVIGNGDLHAKNVSVLWSKVVRLSPGYDLLSTLPYPKLESHMALKLDGRDANLRAAHFAEFGESFGVPEPATRKSIDHILARVERRLVRLPEIGFDDKTTDRLGRDITKRIQDLRR